ncbi:MAG: class I SAM-dependent methyltransferase [Alphaproteobacteria bacterium]|nr:class I SAM-dependent methyltransferase [Alphaproteobacteria bacterium]
MPYRPTAHAEYDDIAAEYAASKQLPFRWIVEAPTLFQLADDVRGKSVLDLACGEGIYARKLARRGAGPVLGIDLSAAMVERARASEREQPLGIAYRVGDAADLGTVGAFDLVLASYLFNYAQDARQLLAFARTVAANLKPGGRLVGINDNPRTALGRFGSYAAYGFSREVERPQRDGARIRYTFPLPDGSSFGFDNFWLAPATYQSVFAEAGLADFRFVDCTAKLGEDDDPVLWAAFVHDCPITGLVARRPG